MLCVKSGCTRETEPGSNYCSFHLPAVTSSEIRADGGMVVGVVGSIIGGLIGGVAGAVGRFEDDGDKKDN